MVTTDHTAYRIVTQTTELTDHTAYRIVTTDYTQLIEWSLQTTQLIE